MSFSWLFLNKNLFIIEENKKRSSGPNTILAIIDEKNKKETNGKSVISG